MIENQQIKIYTATEMMAIVKYSQKRKHIVSKRDLAITFVFGLISGYFTLFLV